MTLLEYLKRTPFRVPFCINKNLTGSKKAVLHRGMIHLSPAMAALADGASPDDINHLYDNIELVLCQQQ